MMVPTHQDILDAAKRIKGKILRTPFIFSDPLSRQVNIRVYLKLESLQPGGSFKFRGDLPPINVSLLKREY
jgi:threonine dehydratase